MASIPVPERDRIPEERAGLLVAIKDRLLAARRVVLTTHVNADGDGMGSEVALARFLTRRGVRVTIVNPTGVPGSLSFLAGGLEAWSVQEARAKRALEDADLIGVLDTAEPSRLGEVTPWLANTSAVVIDHHPPTEPDIGEIAVRDPSACATGELIYDLIRLADDRPTPEEATALYVAIVTDTGSFRFSNTSARAHEIAARLLEAGVDPVAVFRELFGRFTPNRLRLLQAALETLEADGDLPLTWITVTREAFRTAGASSEDTEGIVEYARRLDGTEVAIMFRELADGRTKASLRSNGDVDVSRLARSLGGGGHVKAAGIVLDLPLDAARRMVLDAARESIRVELRATGT